MSAEAYGTCIANKIGGDVDTVVGAIRHASEDAWRAFITWFRGLGDADRALFLAALSIGAGIVVKILEAVLGAVGEEIAAGLVILLGIAAWAAIIDALVECEPQL
jgi:hypothetical protein